METRSGTTSRRRKTRSQEGAQEARKRRNLRHEFENSMVRQLDGNVNRLVEENTHSLSLSLDLLLPPSGVRGVSGPSAKVASHFLGLSRGV